MVTWAEFAAAAPELAADGLARFMRSEIILLGSIRKDGTPRISPVESDIVDGELMAGMMWRSKKALDLVRDPRCVVHSTVHDRMDSMGEFKVRGAAAEVQDSHKRERYCQVLYERISWRPEGDFHLFAFDIESAFHIHYADEKRHVTSWTPSDGVVVRPAEAP
jgi:hypothetical protein